MKQHREKNIKMHPCKSKQTFSCDVCQKTFSKKPYLKQHLRIHTGEKPFSCRVCNKSFAQRGHLMSHMRTHTSEKPFSCSICMKSFVAKSSINSHMNRIHRGIKPQGVKTCSCHICGKTFSKTYYLTRHTRIHTGEKTFTCDFCERKFLLKESLKNHLRTHTGEKPFSCCVCMKSFSTKTYLTIHMKIHGSEKTFSCSTCERKYSQKHQLTRHMKKHSGGKAPIKANLFSCCVCEKSFKQKCSLTCHMRMHTGEKPFPCSLCIKRFLDRANLIKHMRTHTGEKPFSCSVCLKKFRQRTHVKTHMKRHSAPNLISKRSSDKEAMTEYLGPQRKHFNPNVFQQIVTPNDAATSFVNENLNTEDKVTYSEESSLDYIQGKVSTRAIGASKYSLQVNVDKLVDANSKENLLSSYGAHGSVSYTTVDMENVDGRDSVDTLCDQSFSNKETQLKDTQLYKNLNFSGTDGSSKDYTELVESESIHHCEESIHCCFICGSHCAGIRLDVSVGSGEIISLCELCQHVSVTCALCDGDVEIGVLWVHIRKHTGGY